jgi:hypothetical protein
MIQLAEIHYLDMSGESTWYATGCTATSSLGYRSRVTSAVFIV